ncbi:hypothetical protein ACWEOE_38770 [Amycolatopsis sp. NPDC004368]
MTVHRLGADATRDQAARDLGRVLVTIDDLRALINLVSELEEDSRSDSRPRMGFGGGEFEEPEDLVELTDAELEYIWIKSSNVEISFNAFHASAVGKKDLVDAIYNNWARARLTRDRPWIHKRMHTNSQSVFLAVGITGGFSLLGMPADLLNPFTLIFLSVTILTLVGALFVGRITLSRGSYAVVRAVTLSEYRAMRVDSQRHWRTIAMSALAASIALAGIVVGLLFKH